MARLGKSQLKRWRKYISAIKQRYPAPFPVVIRTCRMPYGENGAGRDCGDCVLHKGKFFIRIGNHLDWSMRVDTLIHEYAHALNWSYRHNKTDEHDHEDPWGIWYARLYRVVEEMSCK